jgi:hypothetical protein
MNKSTQTNRDERDWNIIAQEGDEAPLNRIFLLPSLGGWEKIANKK